MLDQGEDEDEDALLGVLLDLAVPHEDVNELIGARAAVLADPGAWRVLDRWVRELTRGLGTPGPDRWPPPAPPGGLGGAAGRCFPVLAFVAALPHTLAYHRRRGIPPEIGRRTLADLGRQMAVHRRRHGTGGLLTPSWLTLHFRGELYQLGRLQFQRARLDDGLGRAVAAHGLPLGPGDPVLELHIPDFSGPLTPAACDRSLGQARAFFARHFPDEPYAVAACRSWLLDPQLAEYLPGDSHIVRFQRRFHLADDGLDEPRDASPVGFVFGDPGLPLDALPRRTALQRAIADHLRAGRHWHVRHGWFPLTG